MAIEMMPFGAPVGAVGAVVRARRYVAAGADGDGLSMPERQPRRAGRHPVGVIVSNWGRPVGSVFQIVAIELR